MGSVWLSAFVIGAFVARHVPADGWVGSLALRLFIAAGALGVFLRLAARLRPALFQERSLATLGVGGVASLAFGWGALHHAPPPPAHLVRASVAKVDVVDARAMPVLLSAHGQRMEAWAPALPGAVVDVRAIGDRGVFGTARTRTSAVFVESAPAPSLTLPASVIAKIRTILQGRLDRLRPSVRGLLSGMLLGERVAFSPWVRTIFMRTGLYHLLIVSGMHVAFIALALSAFLRLPFQLAYLVGLVGPARWQRLRVVLCLTSALCGLLYAGVAGLSAASQRALLLFLAQQLGAIWGGLASRRRLLLAVACAQTVIFPTGFLGEATLMSWGAYLLVLDAASRSAHGGLAGLVAVATMQLKLLVLTGVAFAQLPSVGLIANPLVVGVFPFILVVSLATLAIGPGLFEAWACEILQGFTRIVSAFAGLVDLAPWLYLTDNEVPGRLRAVLVVVGAGALLNALARLSISDESRERRL